MAFSKNDIKNTVLEIDKHGTQQKMAPCKNSTPCIKMPIFEIRGLEIRPFALLPTISCMIQIHEVMKSNF